MDAPTRAELDAAILSLLTEERLLAERLWHCLQMEGPRLPCELARFGADNKIREALARLRREGRARQVGGAWSAVDLPVEVRAANLEVAQVAAIDVLARKTQLACCAAEGR